MIWRFWGLHEDLLLFPELRGKEAAIITHQQQQLHQNKRKQKQQSNKQTNKPKSSSFSFFPETYSQKHLQCDVKCNFCLSINTVIEICKVTQLTVVNDMLGTFFKMSLGHSRQEFLHCASPCSYHKEGHFENL